MLLGMVNRRPLIQVIYLLFQARPSRLGGAVRRVLLVAMRQCGYKTDHTVGAKSRPTAALVPGRSWWRFRAICGEQAR